MMSLWDALRMNMMISYQELVRTFLKYKFIENSFILFLSVALDYTQHNFIGLIFLRG